MIDLVGIGQVQGDRLLTEHVLTGAGGDEHLILVRVACRYHEDEINVTPAAQLFGIMRGSQAVLVARQGEPVRAAVAGGNDARVPALVDELGHLPPGVAEPDHAALKHHHRCPRMPRAIRPPAHTHLR